MTDNDTNSEKGSDEDGTVQLGARVDKELAELVKGLVRHKHGKIRGPLGRSYEKALEYYLGVHLFQHPDDLEVIAETSDIEDTERAVERLREAVDHVGPDLMGVNQALEDTQQATAAQHNQPIPQVPDQQLGEKYLAPSEKQEWKQSTVRQSFIDEDTQIGGEALDRLAERVAEKLEK